jgi:hypothetical protein
MMSLLALLAPARAQDTGFALFGQQAVSHSFNTMNTVIGNNALNAATRPRNAPPRSGSPQGMLGQGTLGQGTLGQGTLGLSDPTAAPARAAAMSLTYQPNDALARNALAAYLQRLKSSNPKLAPLAAEQFGRHDYRQVYRGLTRGTGLRDNDLVDIMSAWTMLGWMVANDSQANPDPTKLKALRNQMAGVLADNPRLADPATRAMLGEEMKIHFVTLHAGWQGAQREGRLPQYAEDVARLFQRTGTDLRQLSMTSQGMVQR